MNTQPVQPSHPVPWNKERLAGQNQTFISSYLVHHWGNL